MTSQEFLAIVLPSSGSYVACGISTGKPKHVFVESIEDLYTQSIQFKDNNVNAFFALASFGDKVNDFGARERTVDNALKIKSLFIDIDCGEGKDYPTRNEAAAALATFLSESSLDTLGTPYVVSSGGGLHVYLPFGEDLEIAVWKPVAENLKRLCKKLNFNIDYSVTGDAARVLRVPDTNNYKQEKPRPVKLKVEGTVFDFDAVAALLVEKLGEQSYELVPMLNIPGNRPKDIGATSVKLMENRITLFKNIEAKSDAGVGCAQLVYYKQHASDDGMEPLFYNIITLAKCCEDGQEAAIRLGGMHPYDTDRIMTKWNASKGPSGCIKFDETNPGVCANCPNYGKFTNPLALGSEIKVDNQVKEIEVKIEVADELVIDKVLTRPAPPKGFSYGSTGGVFADRIIEDSQGNKETKQIMLVPYAIFVLDILNMNGDHQIHMVAQRPEGVVDILIPQKSIISKDETLKALAGQNIIACYGSGNDKNFFDYIRACVEQASANKKAIKVPNNCGWQEDNTFVFNSHVYFPGGAKVFVPTPGLENINQHSKPKGNIDGWREFMGVFVKRGLFDIITMGLVGPASLLMEFTGFNGMTYHLGSTKSGTGKSLALSIAESFFGEPGKYRVGQATSEVALQQRQGLLNSLPLITDEITSKSRDDMEWLPKFLLDQSQGKGKERMESNANRERLNVLGWKATALLSSNIHVFDYFGGTRKHDSQAIMLRILEINPEIQLDWSESESASLDMMKKNYGVAGEKLIKWLVENREEATKILKDTNEKLKREFNSTNSERFWSAGNSCIIAMAIILSSKHANIIDLPIAPLIETLRKMVNKARGDLQGAVRSAEDILNAYTREYYGKFVIVSNKSGTLEASLGGTGIIDESITRSQIAGRVDHELTPGLIDYYIEEAQMRQHCVTMSFGYSDFKKQLEVTPGYVVSYHEKKNILARTKGPSMRVNVIKISRVKYDD